MKILLIGTVQFSMTMLEQLVEMNLEIVGVCTSKSSDINADYVDLEPLCKARNIPCIQVQDINATDTIDWMISLNPDIIFCFGWSQLLKEDLLQIAPLGVIGYHPTEMPKNRGRHPIIWSLALGLKETGSTFFRMDSGADTGEIISQIKIKINTDDNAHSLYEKISQVAKTQLKELVPKLEKGSLEGRRQENLESNTWRKRTHADGLIDWRLSADSINNLVRALSHPYKGAHFMYKAREIKLWESSIGPEAPMNIEPGKILEILDSELVVKCGVGSLRLIRIEPTQRFAKGDYL